MRKCLTSLLVLCLLCIFVTGCNSDETQQPGVSDPETHTSAGPELKIADVDLTVLGSTMVYAEVFNIMSHPDDYTGKTIKMNGPYYASYFNETGLYYHYVIIEDATSCCQQGLEFIWNGNHTYPDDYPKEKARIEVTGVFGSYDELGMTYYYLSVDDITVLG